MGPFLKSVNEIVNDMGPYFELVNGIVNEIVNEMGPVNKIHLLHGDICLE